MLKLVRPFDAAFIVLYFHCGCCQVSKRQRVTRLVIGAELDYGQLDLRSPS